MKVRHGEYRAVDDVIPVWMSLMVEHEGRFPSKMMVHVSFDVGECNKLHGDAQFAPHLGTYQFVAYEE